MMYLLLHIVVTLAAAIWARYHVSSYTPIEKDRLISAGAALSITTALGLLAAATSVSSLKYGWGVFVALPVMCGFLTALIHGWRHPLSVGDSMLVAMYSLGVLGAVLLIAAFEGIICLVMAAPIAIPGAILGGLMAAGVLKVWRDRRRVGVVGMLAVVVPFGIIEWERISPAESQVFAVTTALDIAAPPEEVWKATIAPSKLRKPPGLPFRVGIAYPQGAWIEGTGVGATRFCNFSTGRLVEPVLEWREPEVLRFTVVKNPEPMVEWNPFTEIHPPHLEGFLVSRQGQFRLAPIPGGTRLEATTWYQHGLYPATYWRWWSDAIIHRIHDEVLGHVKKVAEKQA